MARTTASAWKSRRTAIAGVVAVAAITLFVYWVRAGADDAMVATVTRGELTARLTSSGTLKPIQSITYRSPIPGRDIEIRDLAPEGSRVAAGDLLVRLDTTDLDVEQARVRQEHRQVLMDLQVAEGEFEEAGAEVKAVTEGEGALTVEEARSTLLRAQKKTERLRQEYEHLKPLLDKGFITRDELARTEDQLEEAEEELILARRRTDVVVELSHPREQKRAALALAQKSAQLGHARTRASRNTVTARDARATDRRVHDSRARTRPGRLRREPELEPAPQAADRRSRLRDAGHRHDPRSQPHARRSVDQRERGASGEDGAAGRDSRRGVPRPEADRKGDARRHARELVGRTGRSTTSDSTWSSRSIRRPRTCGRR